MLSKIPHPANLAGAGLTGVNDCEKKGYDEGLTLKQLLQACHHSLSAIGAAPGRTPGPKPATAAAATARAATSGAAASLPATATAACNTMLCVLPCTAQEQWD